MMQNTRRSRFLFLLALSILQVAHQHLFSGVPNTPEGMLMFHGTAALADMYLIYVASELLSGELSFQIQCLNLASIIANALGYFAYMQYAAPWFYDYSILGIGCVLLYKLLWIADHDPCSSCGFVVFNPRSRVNQLHN